MYTRVHVWEHMFICAHVYISMWRPELGPGCLLNQFFLFIKAKSLTKFIAFQMC